MNHCPYPGLRPFKKEETAIFFGRENHIDQLLNKLGSTSHFLAVVGPSGGGKSSLVHTGLLASLEQGRFGQTEVCHSAVTWKVAELHPGNRPLANLAKALLTMLGPTYQSQFTNEAEALYVLQKTLPRDSLQDLLAPVVTRLADGPSSHFVFLVDQFEEIFRHYQQGQETEAIRFVTLLLDSCKLANVYVVITMRSDFLGECTLFESLPEIINQSLFLVPRLHREDLQRAIEAPAKVFNGTVEPDLVQQLLAEADNDSDQLPLLQHALMRMWLMAAETNPSQIVLTLSHYQAIGGKLTTALSQHADEAYKELGPAQYKIASVLFRSLTELGNDNRDGRRPVELSNIAAQTNVSWERVAAIVEMFRQSGRCFLSPGEGVELAPNTVINISHESLIREWQRLKNWAKNEAVSAALYQRLELDARFWEEGEAELWHGLNLNNALVWRNLERPNKIWANRYGKHFDLAMRFLEASAARQNEEQRHLEEAQQRELQRQRAHKWVIWSLLALVMVAALAVFEFIQVRNAYQARKQAEIAQQAALASEQARSLNLFESQLTHAALSARIGDYATAKQLLHHSRELDSKMAPSRLHSRNLLAWFSAMMGSAAQKVYTGAQAQLTAVALSPDGRLLATGGEKGTLVLFDVSRGPLQSRLTGHTGHVNALVFHPQGLWLASGGDDQKIIFWSVTAPLGQKLFEWTAPDKVYALAIDPAGKYLASGGKDHNITLWNLANGQPQAVFKGHTDSISEGGLAFNPTGKLLASGAYDDTARLWQVATGETVHILTGHTKDVENVTFSPDGQLLATSSDDTSIRLWEVATGQTLRMFNGHQNRVYGLRFMKEGRELVSASSDSTLRVWDTHSGVTLRVLQGHLGRITGITAQANKIFSASSDGTARQWEITLPYQRLVELNESPATMKTALSISSTASSSTTTTVKAIDADLLKAYTVAIAPAGQSLAIGFTNGSLRLYSLPDTRLLWEQTAAHTDKILLLAFNNEGTLLASASADQTAKIWQPLTGQRIKTLSGHTDRVNAVAFSPDSSLVATAGEDGKIGLFTIANQQVQFIAKAHSGARVSSVTFNQSGTRLLSSGEDSDAIHQWDLTIPSPQLLPSPPGPQNILWATLSPDNKTIASVGSDQLVHIYSLATGAGSGDSASEEQYHLIGHEQTIFRAIFSPDSQQLATASGDATIRFWDLANRGELFTLRLPTQAEGGSPVLDFDFRCTKDNCWIAVPLTSGKLVLYELGKIF